MSEANRRLAGILAADVVGYSAMVGKDEPATLARVRTLRTDIVEPVAITHGGRLFKTTGDGFLASFASAVQALRCAVAIQERLNSEPDGLRLRIGVHQGEVVAEGDDLLGDGVIIAARLEPLAEPGGICISARVREDAAGKMALEVDDLGTPELKGIAGKVQVFCVRLGTAERPALPLPDKPSIAVLPFQNMSGDPEQEYFSDGIADDIITELSRSRSLFVIARNSSFFYKGRQVTIKQIAGELGVRYVLEGSVRRSGSRVRVTAQLIDAGTGAHIWAERYDRTVTDLFAVQDEITEAVVVAIGSIVSDIEQRRALRRPSANLGAWEAYQRGLWHFSRMLPSDAELAAQMFRQSAMLDPQFAPALTAWAMVLLHQATGLSSVPFAETMAQADALARRAVDTAPHDADARGVLAQALIFRGAFVDAEFHVAKAQQINPEAPMTLRASGALLVFTGRFQQGRDVLWTYLRRSPHDVWRAPAMTQIVFSYYHERNYQEALAKARQAIEDTPGHALQYRWAATALGQLGRLPEAKAMLLKAQEVSRTAFDYFVNARPPWVRPEYHEHMLDGLRKAGWQG
jgi:adenylate cyclase